MARYYFSLLNLIILSSVRHTKGETSNRKLYRPGMIRDLAFRSSNHYWRGPFFFANTSQRNQCLLLQSTLCSTPMLRLVGHKWVTAYSTPKSAIWSWTKGVYIPWHSVEWHKQWAHLNNDCQYFWHCQQYKDVLSIFICWRQTRLQSKYDSYTVSNLK